MEQRRAQPFALLLVTVSLGGMLAPLNSTMLAVALPEIRDDLDIGHTAIAWLVSAYLIAMAVAQPIGGRIGDQIGRARVFRGGLIAFLALSLGASVAPSFPLLLALRTGQALVGAAVIPNGMAMLRESVPSSKLGQSSGYTGAALSFAAAVGPLVGAALLAAGSWRFIFLMNVPLVGTALVCQALLPAAPRMPGARMKIDVTGALAFAALLAAVTFVLSRAREGGDVLLLIGIVALTLSGALFVTRQFRSETPITDWSLFRNRSYSAAAAYVLLSNLVMYTTLLTIPFFVREVQGKSTSTSGLLLGSMSVLMAVLAPFAGRLSDTVGRRTPAVAGSAIMLAASIALMTGIATDVSYAYLAISLATLGLGLGLSISSATIAAIEASPIGAAGIAAGTNSMMRYIGSIVGAGVLGSVLSGNAAVPDIDVFRAMFAIVAVMAAFAFVATMFIDRFPGHRDEHRAIPVEVETGIAGG